MLNRGSSNLLERVQAVGPSPSTATGNGKIVVAGSRRFNDFAVARYTSTGRLDGSFGSGGNVPGGLSGVTEIAAAGYHSEGPATRSAGAPTSAATTSR
jgi:hypothetical protein